MMFLRQSSGFTASTKQSQNWLFTITDAFFLFRLKKAKMCRQKEAESLR